MDTGSFVNTAPSCAVIKPLTLSSPVVRTCHLSKGVGIGVRGLRAAWVPAPSLAWGVLKSSPTAWVLPIDSLRKQREPRGKGNGEEAVRSSQEGPAGRRGISQRTLMPGALLRTEATCCLTNPTHQGAPVSWSPWQTAMLQAKLLSPGSSVIRKWFQAFLFLLPQERSSVPPLD